MQLSNKTILLISPESWNHVFVSKHHYAIHLAKRGNKVFYLNPPTSKLSVDKTDYDNVYNVNYKGFLKGLRWFPGIVQKMEIKRVYQILEKICDVTFEVIWSFDNSVFFDFSCLPNKVIKISHIVDLNQNFQTKKAATTADICIGVIPKIVERLKHFNPMTYHIRHGVQEFPNNVAKILLPGQGTVKALYIGNLSMPHIDWDLIIYGAKKCPAIDFIFLGSNMDSINENIKNELKSFGNIYFNPSVKAEFLPNFIQAADILLLIYKKEYFNNYATPHKMMEYLASGKPVISIYNKALEEYAGLIFMPQNMDHWVQTINQTVQNLGKLREQELSEFRRRFAEQNTYEKQIKRVENYLI